MSHLLRGSGIQSGPAPANSAKNRGFLGDGVRYSIAESGAGTCGPKGLRYDSYGRRHN